MIRRVLVAVFKLADLAVTEPVPRGEVAARIAATGRAFEAGNPLLRQIAAAPCPCGAPDCAAAGKLVSNGGGAWECNRGQ